MDYFAAINRVYDHLEHDRVDNAVMACLRIARHMKDYLYSGVFLHEMYPTDKEFLRILHQDMSHLKKDAFKYIWDLSTQYWLDTHKLDFALSESDDGDERDIFAIAVGEIDPEIEQWQAAIAGTTVPPGMSPYDTAAFTDAYTNQKAQFRLRIKALHTVKQRIKTRCLNYAILIERQLEGQKRPQSFLEQAQKEVNNYFKVHMPKRCTVNSTGRRSSLTRLILRIRLYYLPKLGGRYAPQQTSSIHQLRPP